MLAVTDKATVQNSASQFVHRRMTLRTNSPAPARHGFSLIELLVVIAIVALLIAILLPSIGRAKDQARLVLCKSNLREWGQATQMYRVDFKDFLPQEGEVVPTPTSIQSKKTWYNLLPPYLGAPRYRDIQGAAVNIKALPNDHIWTCPAKNVSHLYTSESGKNQFHYAMNNVLDGTGDEDEQDITPGFADINLATNNPNFHLRADRFGNKPFTVFMTDILPNLPNGDPASVGDTFTGHGTLHRKAANVLYVNGGVASFKDSDFVQDAAFRDPVRIWNHPQLYWGYLPQDD